MLGGALLGGTAGSLISCREIGVQNETHFMMNEFRKVYHPEGFVVGASKIVNLGGAQTGFHSGNVADSQCLLIDKICISELQGTILLSQLAQ